MKYCYDEGIIKYYGLQIEIIFTSIIYGPKYLTDVQRQRNKHTEGRTHADICTHRRLICHSETTHYDHNTLAQTNFRNRSTSRTKMF